MHFRDLTRLLDRDALAMLKPHFVAEYEREQSEIRSLRAQHAVRRKRLVKAPRHQVGGDA